MKRAFTLFRHTAWFSFYLSAVSLVFSPPSQEGFAAWHNLSLNQLFADLLRLATLNRRFINRKQLATELARGTTQGRELVREIA